MSPFVGEPGGGEPFAAVLREKLAELDADEAAQHAPPDPLEDFRAATSRAVLEEHGGPLPRVGHQAYLHPPQAVTEQPTRAIDIRS